MELDRQRQIGFDIVDCAVHSPLRQFASAAVLHCGSSCLGSGSCIRCSANVAPH